MGSKLEITTLFHFHCLKVLHKLALLQISFWVKEKRNGRCLQAGVETPDYRRLFPWRKYRNCLRSSRHGISLHWGPSPSKISVHHCCISWNPQGFPNSKLVIVEGTELGLVLYINRTSFLILPCLNWGALVVFTVRPPHLLKAILLLIVRNAITQLHKLICFYTCGRCSSQWSVKHWACTASIGIGKQ